jgi:MinD superfamily P-loop ATPase
MSKVIAVWGAPNSGKTTFATKLARCIYDEYQATVIVVYTDNETPTLPIIFPNYKKEDLCSVGVALAKTDIDRYEVVKQMVTVKDKQNFCFLGFTDGENRYTYPAFDATKVRSLYSVLASLADYVIVDCTSSLKNPLAKVAVREADTVIRLSAPTLKSVSFMASQLPLYADPMFRLEEHIEGINVIDEDLYMPIDEARSHMHDVRFTIPYSRAVKQQMLDGDLYEVVGDKKFNGKFKAIVEKIV